MSATEVQPRFLEARETSASFSLVLTIALCFYVFAMATSMSFMEIAAALLFVLFLLSPYPVLKLSQVPMVTPVLLFLAVAVLGIALGESTVKEKLYDLGRMRFFLVYFILFFFLTNRQREGETYVWLKVLRVTLSLVGVYGFVQHFVAIDLIRPEGKKVLLYALQDEKIGPLVVGTFNHHLTFSNSYLFFACLFFSLGLRDPKKHAFDLSLGALLFLLVFWTQSRIAWVAIPLCLVVLSVCHFGKRALLVSGLASVLFVGGVYAISPSFQERLAKTFQTSDPRSFVPRLNLWKAQVEMWKEKPVLGVGWNNNERHSKRYVDRLPPSPYPHFYGHAHSVPLQILTTTGILGFLLFLWLWGKVFWLSVQGQKSKDPLVKALAIGAFASFIGFWIQGLTQWNFGDAEVLYTLVFFWALVASLSSLKLPNSTHS